jgi:hypothetical protein
MKKVRIALALAGLFLSSHGGAISFNDIQLWAGSGTNRAAVVIEWNAPEISNYSTVPAPIANKTMVWGYRFNGTATGTQMLYAILAADPKLYLYITNDPTFGTGVNGIGYNLSGNGVIALTDGTSTNYFYNGLLTNASVNADAAAALNPGDLYFGGHFGPGWQIWTEENDMGGFDTSPNRGTNAFADPDTGDQGQWDYAGAGLDGLPVTDGSWIGFSVTADGYPTNGDPNSVLYSDVFFDDEQAPPSPDGTYVAYVPDANDFAAQIISTNNIDSGAPYNNPTAILGAPALQFYDPIDGGVTDRVSIIDPVFNTSPAGSNLITVIQSGGEITAEMGHKIYADASHPYGVDLIIYGNTFFSAGAASDATDLSTKDLNGMIFEHQAAVSVSQDGTTWVTLTNAANIYPDEAYRWDDTNSSWTEEEMNPTKPLNPCLYTNNFSGQTVAAALDQFIGASGGTGLSLQGSGLPWIQYIRIQPPAGVDTVIDAIAAVNPVVLGDALSIMPDDIADGTGNLDFQNTGDCGQNQISIGFASVSKPARISTVSLSDLDPFAPVEGDVSSAYQIQSRPLIGTNVTYDASVGLYAGANYSGNGSDLRVFEWNCTNWVERPFTYSAADNEVAVAGVTNFSAFVVSQIVRPSLAIETLTNGYAFQFTPVPNCPETLECSTNLMGNWQSLCSFTATNAQPITLQDTDAPPGNAFYRLELNP